MAQFGFRKDFCRSDGTPKQGVETEAENVAIEMDLGGGRIGTRVAWHEGAAAVDPEPINQQNNPAYGLSPADPYYNTAVSPPSYYPQEPPAVQPHPQSQPPATQMQKVKVMGKNEAQVVQEQTSGYGDGAATFATIISYVVGFFGCWWSFICTFPAIFLASIATSARKKGNVVCARISNIISVGCTWAGIVSAVVGLALTILFAIIYSHPA